METSTKKRLSPAVIYFLSGILAGWPALIATGWAYPQWREGVVGGPISLAAIHALILGSMFTIAFGVLYQIIPIAFQAPPNPRRVLYWHLPLHLFAVLVMALGFALYRFLWVGIGGVILIISTIGFFSVILNSYRKARNKTIVHRWLVFPFLALALVLLVGIFQAFWPSEISRALLVDHAMIGGLAFWVGLVLVLSYKLVPMFVISHGYKASLKRTAALYLTGVLLFIAAAWFHGWALITLELLAAVCMIGGIASFVWDLAAIVRARKKHRIVLPMYDAFFATSIILIALLCIIAGALTANVRVTVDGGYLLLFGGLVPLMFAYLQKMVPFLWFEYRFSKRPERKTAPLIDDMVNRRVAQSGIILYYIGIVAGLFALILQSSGVSAVLGDASAFFLLVGSVAILQALWAVIRIGGKRPDDDPKP